MSPPVRTGRTMEKTPSACRICNLWEGLLGSSSSVTKHMPSGIYLKVKAHQVREAWDGLWSWHPSSCTFDPSQEVLDGYPSKTESLLLLKALAETTQMADYSKGRPFPGELSGVLEAKHVFPQRSREADKAGPVRPLLEKYKAAPTSCKQHLVPSLVCVDNPKTAKIFMSRFCCCWKMSRSFSFDQFLKIFSFF